MRYTVELERLADGGYAAICIDPVCSFVGRSPEDALEGLRTEIRYVLEICPCSTPTLGAVELEVVSTA